MAAALATVSRYLPSAVRDDAITQVKVSTVSVCFVTLSTNGTVIFPGFAAIESLANDHALGLHSYRCWVLLRSSSDASMLSSGSDIPPLPEAPAVARLGRSNKPAEGMLCVVDASIDESSGIGKMPRGRRKTIRK